MQATGDGGRIAVVGAGIAGLSAAWLLSRSRSVTLIDRQWHVGGHADSFELADGRVVDTGFIVHNAPSYPNYAALLSHLGIETIASEMSFAVSLRDGALEYAGTSLGTLFAQPRNLIRLRFWSMLADLVRLYRQAPRSVSERLSGLTLGAFLDRHGYGAALAEDHLLPMAAAIWSCPFAAVREHPAEAFVRFCDNHGLFRFFGRPQWRTIAGGSRAVVARMAADIGEAADCSVELGCVVRGVERTHSGVILHDDRGRARRFDRVVLAGDAPTALESLAQPTARERALLGAFRVTENEAVLHRDSRLMPRRRRVWSSWNVLGGTTHDRTPPMVTYWMNRLQGLDGEELFVTLNPDRAIAGGDVLRRRVYRHPVFDLETLAAQRRLWALQGAGGVWFCGAWFGSGFHEDGLQAGLAVAEAMGGVARPWRVDAPSGRIFLPEAAALPPERRAA